MGQDQDDQPFPLMGWLTVIVLVVGAVIFFMAVRTESKESDIDSPPSTVSYEDTTMLIVDELETSYPSITHPDPVARRQIHHLRRHLATCVAHRLTATLPSTIGRTTSDGRIHAQLQQHIQEHSTEVHTACADTLLDQFLNDAPAARIVAQSIKASGIPLDDAYGQVGAEWPSQMGESKMTRLLSKTIGP